MLNLGIQECSSKPEYPPITDLSEHLSTGKLNINIDTILRPSLEQCVDEYKQLKRKADELDYEISKVDRSMIDLYLQLRTVYEPDTADSNNTLSDKSVSMAEV